MVMDEHFHYSVAVAGDSVVAHGHVGELGTTAEAPRPKGDVVLRIETTSHIHGPDTVRLGFETDHDQFKVLAEIDGRYLSTEVTGGFIGRTIGMFAAGCTAAFDWFDYQPTTGEETT